MTKVTYISNSAGGNSTAIAVPLEALAGRRHLTEREIEVLKHNLNTSEDPLWQNVVVDKNDFDPNLVRESSFHGFVALGPLRRAFVKYHDLELETGVYRSRLRNVATGADVVICNVAYLENYRIGNAVLLFNIQEMSCTAHSKFGAGILKNGESENDRIWIGVGNENGGRAVLPFESMITADAWLWSHYRDDKKLMQALIGMTERGNSGALDTYGTVGDGAVVKNTVLIKDAKIGAASYIKGALKLKNITVLSSEDESSQIGEGVEMVNGIMGYASRVFYQAVAVRFVIGRNCQLKYGARLLNSVLGDNSTVSCCEILNNLIFPFHEQHHNSSFLIAATLMGQSNIASGATIGSNHNSRSPDGEIVAKRGFWPGLCSDFKHNSYFASFTLAAKGSYQNELDIRYPFSLISAGINGDMTVHVMPAWWFMYDMFAIVRNKYKFIERDKRRIKIQHIETDPIAPDTIQEVMMAIERIIDLTAAQILPALNTDSASMDGAQEKRRQAAKDFLHQNPNADFTLSDSQCQRKYGGVIFKPVRAYKMYRSIVKYFAARAIIQYCPAIGEKGLTKNAIERIRSIRLCKVWQNAGGQIIPDADIENLRSMITDGRLSSWESVHKFYDEKDSEYLSHKARYALHLLECLYSRPIEKFTREIYDDIISDVSAVSCNMYSSSLESRKKDFTDYYRKMTYRNKEEMEAVLGRPDDSSFLRRLHADTQRFNEDLRRVFAVI